jgi:hypothetical protein
MENIFSNIPPEQLSILASSIAAAVSKELSGEDALLLGSFISTIGGSLQLIGAQRSLAESRQSSQQDDHSLNNNKDKQSSQSGQSCENVQINQTVQSGVNIEKRN